jgi:hypothetical protein
VGLGDLVKRSAARAEVGKRRRVMFPSPAGCVPVCIPFSSRAHTALDGTHTREALRLGHIDVGIEYILLALLRQAEGLA